MKPLTPQELSIGNLLNYDTGEGIELTVIDWQDLKWLQENPKSFNNSHSPVPLTPEILDGFGFCKNEDRFYFSLPNINSEVHFEPFRGGLVCVLYCSIGQFVPIDQHAHTLQNFIHAISGVELVYKQKKTE